MASTDSEAERVKARKVRRERNREAMKLLGGFLLILLILYFLPPMCDMAERYHAAGK